MLILSVFLPSNWLISNSVLERLSTSPAIFILSSLISKAFIENRFGFWVTFISIAFFSDKLSSFEMSVFNKKLVLLTFSNSSFVSYRNGVLFKSAKDNFLSDAVEPEYSEILVSEV